MSKNERSYSPQPSKTERKALEKMEKEERIQNALGLVAYEVTFYDGYGNFVYSGRVKVSDAQQAKVKIRLAAIAAGIAKKALKFSKAVRIHT